jgi:hypothetical protein
MRIASPRPSNQASGMVDRSSPALQRNSPEGPMRLSLTILAALSPLLAIGMPTGTAQAAITKSVITAVVSNCPVKTIGVCADAVGDFLDRYPSGAERDIDIVRVVMALADAAEHPNITVPMCVELQQSMLKLGAAVTQPAPQQEIKELAAELCKGDRTITGSVGDDKPTPADGPPPSLIDQVSSSPPAGKDEPSFTPCYNSNGDIVTCE